MTLAFTVTEFPSRRTSSGELTLRRVANVWRFVSLRHMRSTLDGSVRSEVEVLPAVGGWALSRNGARRGVEADPAAIVGSFVGGTPSVAAAVFAVCGWPMRVFNVVTEIGFDGLPIKAVYAPMGATEQVTEFRRAPGSPDNHGNHSQPGEPTTRSQP